MFTLDVQALDHITKRSHITEVTYTKKFQIKVD
jgi:hypothetical protein